MKAIKKVICLLLAFILTAAVLPVSFAASADAGLQFDENGAFTILHMSDWHCGYPLPAVHKQLVLESIDLLIHLIVYVAFVCKAFICIVFSYVVVFIYIFLIITFYQRKKEHIPKKIIIIFHNFTPSVAIK